MVAIGSFLYGNSAAEADHMFAWCRKRDVPVPISVFDPGFLRAVLVHLAAGTLPERVKIQLYFGASLPFGLPPTMTSLAAYLALLDGTGLPWMVGVMGGDVLGTELAAAAVRNGGRLRVGLEDYRGAATPRNEDLVTAAVDAVHALGEEVATPTHALEVLADRTVG